MLAHDLVNELDRVVDGGSLLIKVDMFKAFDRVEWLEYFLIFEDAR